MNKKTFLTIVGAMALSLSGAKAQEADRFVGAQHVKFQTACHPEDVKHTSGYVCLVNLIDCMFS